MAVIWEEFDRKSIEFHRKTIELLGKLEDFFQKLSNYYGFGGGDAEVAILLLTFSKFDNFTRRF